MAIADYDITVQLENEARNLGDRGFHITRKLLEDASAEILRLRSVLTRYQLLHSDLAELLEATHNWQTGHKEP